MNQSLVIMRALDHSYKRIFHESIRSFSTTDILFRGPRRKYLPKVRRQDFWPDKEHTRPKGEKRSITWDQSILSADLADLRNKYPEFLPVDDPNLRHPLSIKLERQEMLKRRSVIEIPEFYVGSIMAVVLSDPHAPGKMSRFVGICIERGGQGLRANFTLRNYIENEGVEIRYMLYNPTIRSIEVLKLEKRIDDHLLYLRDADPEFSTFPFDMEAEPHDPSKPVPVNPLKVRMKPFPWTQSWHVVFPAITGFEKLENVPDYFFKQSRQSHYEFEKYDLMLQYRMHIPEEDQVEIWSEVDKHEKVYGEQRRIEKRKRLLKKE